MNGLIELGYLRVEVADPARLAAFFAEIVGLAPGTPTPAGDLTLTDDAAAQRLVIGHGPLEDLAVLGFEAVDEPAFTTTVERVTAAGWAGVELAEAALAERRAARVVAFDAPWGSSVEIALGLERVGDPALPLMPGGFLTAGVGFGHAVIGTMEFDASVRFATEGLGMVQSDWLTMELAPGIDLEVRFFHCNSRHHTLALARAPFKLPQQLHHVMFETNETDDVGRAYDRAFTAGLPLPNGLGRHDNDRMFSFYVASPAGFQVEVGHGARVITEPWADDRHYDRISAWGHQPVVAPPVPD